MLDTINGNRGGKANVRCIKFAIVCFFQGILKARAKECSSSEKNSGEYIKSRVAGIVSEFGI